MKIGVIADIHGNYDALMTVIVDMHKNDIDSVIVLGDIIFSGTEPQKCFERIKMIKPIVWIKGNTDNWFNEINENFKPKNELENNMYNKFLDVNSKVSKELIETIKTLKEKEETTIRGVKILCVHGSDRKINEGIGILTPQEDISELFNRLNHDILLCAHTHSPFIATKNGKLIMNVGSVGLPSDESRASYGILKFEDDNFEYSIRKIKI
ncbi:MULTISPECIES: YfcE family phosphodiesterase [Clostridium]|uniref:Phosphoesterase n=1 Tax=Clostridium cibarium TaxID=2762247 RepID=A0ABR8PW11_9CLOT|nr:MULTISPECIES: YfcE family phosphodiesterase [Clostridium]MBD7912346.1 metallophosphoesterase family protein [Clostridium cibarium]